MSAGRSVTGVRLGDWCVDATLGGASRFVEDVHHACGDLAPRFRPPDAQEAYPGGADHTYGVFLPKHRAGIPAVL